MAKVTVKEAVTKVIEPEKVVLELSRDEAETMFLICGSVTGHPRHSRRRDADAVFHALKSRGFSTEGHELPAPALNFSQPVYR
ncbi:hypothetical protein [Burkholderia ubonensis]|uniref:hypothetical protein n=1 Tax=Burkholderia ubonensis TaxID=101571 RepID=UPI000A5132C7|nr:hypothetical protein [Burkholderia ubonensis]